MVYSEKRKAVNPTEFAEAYLDGIKLNQTTGTFLVSYRGGRPIRIREVNELAISPISKN